MMLHAASRTVGVLWRRMTRRKTLTVDTIQPSPTRSLTIFDITLLGSFVMLGVSMRDAAGASLLVSLVLAAPAAILSTLCYTELGARLPKAGSIYVSSYACVGEFFAFCIGWMLTFEHMTAAALVGRVWSGHIDSLFGGTISNSTKATVTVFHEYFTTSFADPLAASVLLVFSGLLAAGVRCSTNIKSFFIVLSMGVVAFASVFGLYWADIANWQSPGGFAPYGVTGVTTGASVCFCALVGFSSVSTLNEDARDDARPVVLTAVIAVALIAVNYFIVTVSLSLMVPFTKINLSAVLPEALASHEIYWTKYLVIVVSLTGLTVLILGALLAMSRTMYLMACDGLLCEGLAVISDKTRVPVWNILVCGLCCAFVSLLFDIKHLTEMMSASTLLIYTIITAAVIILRYLPERREGVKGSDGEKVTAVSPSPATPFPSDQDPCSSTLHGGQLKPQFQWLSLVFGRHASGVVVCWSVVAFTIVSGMLSILVQRAIGDVSANRMLYDEDFQEKIIKYPALWELAQRTTAERTRAWAIVLTVFLSVLLLSTAGFVWAHCQNGVFLVYQLPMVPLLPLVVIFCNMVLLVHLDTKCILWFLLWILIGTIIYLVYGMHHSREREPLSSYTALLGHGAASEQVPPNLPDHCVEKPSQDEVHQEPFRPEDTPCVEEGFNTGVISAVQEKLFQVGNRLADTIPGVLKGRLFSSGYGGLDDSGEDKPFVKHAQPLATEEVH